MTKKGTSFQRFPVPDTILIPYPICYFNSLLVPYHLQTIGGRWL